jgi:carbonic anhydrase
MADNHPALKQLLENNRAWAKRVSDTQPDFFARLAKQQAPEYLWIGCSDSRVPANQIVGLLPGEVFVHRNVANQVMQVDFNCLAVLQYAVEILRVRQVIVCGHYGCGGVQAALHRQELGLIDNWLFGVDALRERHQKRLDALPDPDLHLDALCEFNVIEQVRNVCTTSILRQAWKRGQDVSVHGLIYGLNDGRLNDLNMTIGGGDDLEQSYERAITAPRLVLANKPL